MFVTAVSPSYGFESTEPTVHVAVYAAEISLNLLSTSFSKPASAHAFLYLHVNTHPSRPSAVALRVWKAAKLIA